MLIEYVAWQVPATDAGALELAFYQAAAPLRAGGACPLAELGRAHDGPGRYVARFEWTSAEARAAFLSAAGGRTFLRALAGFDPALVSREDCAPVHVFAGGCC